MLLILTHAHIVALDKRLEIILVTSASAIIEDLASPGAAVVEIPWHPSPTESYDFRKVADWVRVCERLFAWKMQDSKM